MNGIQTPQNQNKKRETARDKNDWQSCRQEIDNWRAKSEVDAAIPHQPGRRIALSNGRRLIDDVIRYAVKAPMAAVSRDLDLSYLNTLRRKSRPKISWNVLMMKAYGIVCEKRPELRRVYVPLPWPHLYEHHETVCMMTMIREYKGEERLFFARFGQPHRLSLAQLQTQYDFFRRAPVEEIKQFRHQIRFAKAPWFVRRFGWWTLFNLWPAKRASHMGTFGMSISRYQGATGNQHLGPNTSILGVDPLPRKGVNHLLYTFDHRIIDGKPATDIVEDLKSALMRPVTFEIKQMLKRDGIDPEVLVGQKAA